MGKQVKKHGYSCKLVRVVDGDTCDAMIDLGFDVWVKEQNQILWCGYLGIENKRLGRKSQRFGSKGLCERPIGKFR